MKNYNVLLECDVPNTFKTQMAANSLDIDIKKKSRHSLTVQADIESPFSIGLIVGASGSGKTTLAFQMFGEDCFKEYLDLSKPVIEQFPESFKYEDCARALTGIGLTSVPCWIRPAYTLSNGQRTRAEIALQMAKSDESEIAVIDEWTSVVDRTVAKVMSHSVQKFARRQKRSIVLCSCHYDVLEWLNPDWIIDVNKQEYIDRRLLRQDERERKEKLTFEIREAERSSWKYFSKYHYLNEKLPGGKNHMYGLFHGKDQVGFLCFVNYVPIKKNTIPIWHGGRVVMHPDYVGLGVGLQFINETFRIFKKKTGFDLRATFSTLPLVKNFARNGSWKFLKKERKIGLSKYKKNPIKKKHLEGHGRLVRGGGFRSNVTTYSFKYIG